MKLKENLNNQTQSVSPKPKKDYSWIIFIFLFLALLLIFLIYFWMAVLPKPKIAITLNNQANTNANLNSGQTSVIPEVEQLSAKYEVIIKENPTDKTKSDVYLKDKITGEENFYITLDDIYTNHYHNLEFHNNLYIIRRIGYDGYPDNDWTDELWRYDMQKKGTKLYSDQGLDFRVSDNEKYIAISDQYESDKNESGYAVDILILDYDGNLVKKFTAEELDVVENGPWVDFIGWSDDVLWIEYGEMSYIEGIVKINAAANKIDKMPLPIGIYSDVAINPKRELIAYSTSPDIWAFESCGQDYGIPPSEPPEVCQAIFDIYLYDLETGEEQIVAQTVGGPAFPGWLDENTLTYKDPTCEEAPCNRLTITIP